METNVTLGEEIVRTIKTKVDERYNHYVKFGIPLDPNPDKLNEKEWKKREIKRILESIEWNLNNY